MGEAAEIRRAPKTVQAMRDAVVAFLGALDDRQRVAATAAFDTPDHREWTYLPGPRPGLSLEEMTTAQQELALAMLDAGLSARGAAEARDIISLEDVLAEIERATGGSVHRRDSVCYWFRVLGDPTGAGPWAWRANGHHIAVHLTVVGDLVAATPQFFGANPAVVPHGERAGHQALAGEENLARDLLSHLETAQRPVAIVARDAPDDIRTRHDPVADFGVVPRGLRHADMTEPQQELLTGLVRHYLGRAAPEVADAAWRSITDGGLDDVAFAWAGSEKRGGRHYYAVSGPTFLLEYDNTQNNANHVHTVWRDAANDWGEDILAAHYATHHA